MMPVCSATPSCSSHPQNPRNGDLRFSPFRNDLVPRCTAEDRIVFGFQSGIHVRRISFKTQAARSLYSNFNDWSSSVRAINEMDPTRGYKLEHVESYSISNVEEGLMDIIDQSSENADSFTRFVEPDIMSIATTTPENPSSLSDSLSMNNGSLASAKTSFKDLLDAFKNSTDTFVNKGENTVKTSLDLITSSITSITKTTSEAVNNALTSVFSSVDQTRGLASKRLTGFSIDVNEATSKATTISVDLLRATIITLEDSLAKGASFVVFSYGSVKELLPPEIRSALNLSEEKAIQVLNPIGTVFQQVYVAVEGLEKNVGLDPNDPIVPFFLVLGTSTTLWVCYRAWTYGGYSGDLSPQSTLELLSGKEDAVLIDVRPEVLRERDGIPDLRRAARFRYASVTLPEVDEPLRKLLKGGRDLENTLTAAVIRNLKIVKGRSKVIVMDADGAYSKGIARSLRRLGTKRSYLVLGGFQSWVQQGLRVKELKPETALSVLSEEAEAILQDISPTPVQVLGFGAGSVAVLYALLEWETTLQVIGIIGLALSAYGRFASYEGAEDFRQDVSLLLLPVRIGAQAFSWTAGKLESNGIGLPTSPSSSDVQNRVLQAAAKHESQPSETGVAQNASESAAPVNENVDFSEA
ncbi:calcium sensing receptor, chloroplastic [Euphorbia lathyris]|uniref:calcium sensing receptor, chloroplastic n=1 Tax=Euphorbia lathyris TaxID=212925 RepID=UPI0033131D7A